MCLYLDFVIVMIISFCICSMCYVPIDNGHVCGEGDNLGICKIITECPTAWNILIETSDNPFQRCGFMDDGTEITCCPDFKDDATPNNGIPDKERIWGLLPVIKSTEIPRFSAGHRKSEKACREYKMMATVPSLDTKITDGTDAVVGEFPHMAQIGYERHSQRTEFDWKCGGSLIHPRFVLTAAHCVEISDNNGPKIVRLGFVDERLSNDASVVKRTVHKCYVHSHYHRTLHLNDIALIELADEINGEMHVYPACLYQENNYPSDMSITGWGHTTADSKMNSPILQKGDINVSDMKNCNEIYKKRSLNITSNQICCVGVGNMIDTCQGDSGGPLQIPIEDDTDNMLYAIVGVTSHGVGCGDGVTPGVYTRVSSYIDWIETRVWP